MGSAADLPYMPQFNFQFGKKKPDKKQIIIISIVLSSIIAALSQCTGVSENGLWDLLDEIQRKYFPQTILNEIFIQDPNKVERRVTRDVDAAILEYERLTGDTGEVRIIAPRLVEKPPDGSKAQELLGGEMRLCSPWVLDCPKE
jgi:hypothetical protein